MVVNIGVRVDENSSFLQVLFGTIKPVLFEVNPTKTVQVRAICRVLVHGFLNHSLGLSQIDATNSEHVTEVIQDSRIVLVEFQSLSKRFLRLVVLLLFFAQ